MAVFDLLNAALALVVPSLADWYLWFGTMMVGNVVVWGEHWGKLPWSERFESPLKCFVWLVGFSIIGLTIVQFVSPLVENWLYTNASYLVGTTSGILGVFYVWFIMSGDWSFKTDFKWVPPILFFGTTVLNFLFYHPENLPFSTSWISLIFMAMILIPTVLLIFGGGSELGVQ